MKVNRSRLMIYFIFLLAFLNCNGDTNQENKSQDNEVDYTSYVITGVPDVEEFQTKEESKLNESVKNDQIITQATRLYDLKIMTWNVLHVGSEKYQNNQCGGEDICWDNSPSRIIHAVRNVFAPKKPDIIGLQEVAGRVDGNWGYCDETSAQNEQIEDQFLYELKRITGLNYKIAWFVREADHSFWDGYAGMCYVRRYNALIYNADIIKPVDKNKVSACMFPGIGLDECPIVNIDQEKRRNVFRGSNSSQTYQICRNETMDGSAPDGLSYKNGAEFCVSPEQLINWSELEDEVDNSAILAGGEFKHLSSRRIFNIYNLHPTAGRSIALSRTLRFIYKVEKNLDTYYSETDPTIKRLPPIIIGDFNANSHRINIELGCVSGNISCGGVSPDSYLSPYIMGEPRRTSSTIDKILLGTTLFNPLTVGGEYSYPDIDRDDSDYYWNEGNHLDESDPEYGIRQHSDHPAIYKKVRIRIY